jgi:hypothetical protein
VIDSFSHERGFRRVALVLVTWTWCLPTTLVGIIAGLFALVALGGRAAPFHGATVIRSPRLRSLGGVCLGPVILVADMASTDLVRHEWGHFRQHLRLGPLYLLIIGVPSVTHALWHRLRRGTFPEYFHFWTEAWADALGGVYEQHAHIHRHWLGYAVGPVVAVCATLLTIRGWGHALGYGFTDADALVDVAWARYPLADQLLAPLTGGLGGSNANFWRPAAMVQFWALRHVFGEDPAGWHAWSLALHVACSVLVALVVEALVPPPGGRGAEASQGGESGEGLRPEPRGDRWWIAVLSGLLFAAHPLAEEIVPATARNLDLLLGVGFFGALLCYLRLCAGDEERRSALALGGPLAPGGGTLPHRVASVLFFAFAALALGSKEAGVLILPVCALWAWRRAPLGTPVWRSPAMVRLVPFAVFAAVFLAIRSEVLEGVGGYKELGPLTMLGGLGYALERAFFEPFVASISPVLAPFRYWSLPLVAAAWWALWRATPERRGLWLDLLALYLPWIVLLGITTTYSRRVIYVPSIVMCVVLAVIVVTAVRTRARGWVVSAVLLGALYLHGSPAVRRYTDWGVMADAAAPFLDGAVWRNIPEGATVWLVDRPTRIDGDPRRYRLWTDRKSLNNAATSYSVEAWVDEHVRDLDLKVGSSLVMQAPLSDWAAELGVQGGVLTMTRKDGPRTISEGVTVVDDGAVLTFTADDAWFVVWNPDRAVAVRVGGL